MYLLTKTELLSLNSKYYYQFSRIFCYWTNFVVLGKVAAEIELSGADGALLSVVEVSVSFAIFLFIRTISLPSKRYFCCLAANVSFKLASFCSLERENMDITSYKFELHSKTEADIYLCQRSK